jgi:CMP-N-acetylneuraminic acid synthetase
LFHFDRNFEANTIRQKRKKLYYPNGSVYTFWTKNIQKFNSIYGPKISSVIIDEQKYSIDIDTNFELSLANLIQRFLK